MAAPWDDSIDEAFMARIARDDATAFDALFSRHQTSVYNFLFRCVGERSLAEDLTQDCFLRVWRARHGYERRGAFRTWIFTIARRLALDEAKKLRPPTTSYTTSGNEALSQEEFPDPHCGNPLERTLTNELERRIEAEMARLPVEFREVLLLRDGEGLGYEQIAEVVGCPVGTVRSRLNAARNRLKAVIDEWRKED